MTDEKVKILLLFIQQVETDKGKKGNRFLLLTRDEWEESKAGNPSKFDDLANGGGPRVRVFDKAGKGLSPGQVIEIEATDYECNSVFPGTERYLGLWGDKEARQQWRILHESWLT